MFRLQTKSFLRTVVIVLAVSIISVSFARAQTRQRVTGKVDASTPVTMTTQGSSTLKPEQQQPRVSVRLKGTLAGHTKDISEIAFSPDGEMLATGSRDGTIRLWSASTGETKSVLTLAEKHELGGLLWSNDGRKFLAYTRRGNSKDVQLRIWDSRTGELKVTIEPHYNNFLTDYAWSPDGRVVLTASEDGTVELWDAETGRLQKSLSQSSLNPDETKSIVASLFTDKKYAGLRATRGYFGATGESLLTLSLDGSPKLWDVASGKMKNMLPLTEEDPNAQYPAFPTRALFSPDRRLVVRHDDDGVWLLDTTTGLVKFSLGKIGEPLAFSPDGQSLLVVTDESKVKLRGGDDVLKLYDVMTGQLQLTFEKVPRGVNEIYWSPDGRNLIMIGGGETKTRLLDARTGRVKARLPYGGCTSDSLFGSGGCERFSFSADGRMLLKQKSPLKLWSAETGELLTTLDNASGRAASFSPTDKGLLITKGKDEKTALLWEVAIQ